MALINYHTKCRVCNGQHLTDVLNLGDHYLHGLFIFDDFIPPIAKVPTHLVRCDPAYGGCGLVQLMHSIDPDILYSRYGYRSSTNATMRAHLTKIAIESSKLWEDQHPYRDKNSIRFLDIGCNDGFLLKQLPKETIKFGIDPCDIGNKITGIDNFTFVNDQFPSPILNSLLKINGLSQWDKFDIITMIACFYDLNDPVTTAKEIRRIISDDGILIIEVSYWPDKMLQNAVDEICHEHVCFYNYQNLENVFQQSGFRIFNVTKNSINGGSIQIWMTPENQALLRNNLYQKEEFKKNILAVKFDEFNKRLDTSKPYEKFLFNILDIKKEIHNLFEDITKNNKTVHLYGASTKGNVLLQFLELDSSVIPFAAERSIEKVGGRTLGTNIKMIGEQESRDMKPDYYFVPIWSFRDEIIEREKMFLEGGGKLIFPLPKLEIIGK